MKLARTHPATTLLVLLYFLVATAPAGQRLLLQSKSTAPADFPCAEHACGCTNALDCLRGCCCASGSGNATEGVLNSWTCAAGSPEDALTTILAFDVHLPAESSAAGRSLSSLWVATTISSCTQTYSDPPEAVPRATA